MLHVRLQYHVTKKSIAEAICVRIREKELRKNIKRSDERALLRQTQKLFLIKKSESRVESSSAVVALAGIKVLVMSLTSCLFFSYHIDSARLLSNNR